MKNRRNKNSHIPTKKMMLGKQYGFVESFCGAGGISLGLKAAEFVPMLAFDLNDKAVATHLRNMQSPCLVADAVTLTSKQILHEINLRVGELALFAGGPPCQGFSKQRRGERVSEDPRNLLVLQYLRLVRELRPKFFFFENVAIFGQKRGQKYLEEMFKTLTEYALYPHFYNTADYGLAQTRERFIVVGRRRDIKATFQIPKPTVKKWKTVGEVLSGLPEPPMDYSDHPKFPNHQRARVTEINIKRFSYVPQGGGWRDIPNEFRLPCHKDDYGGPGGWPDVYGRLASDGQCPTITGGFDSFTRGRYGHPTHDRPITPREAARLQGFPDWYIFVGNRGDVRTQIGNAVPPPLVEAIGKEIMKSLLRADGLLIDDEVDDYLKPQLDLVLA